MTDKLYTTYPQLMYISVQDQTPKAALSNVRQLQKAWLTFSADIFLSV
jgi:hypothetical protein